MIYPLIISLIVLLSYFKAIKYGHYVIDDEDVSNAKLEPKNKWQKLWWQIMGRKYSDPQAEHLITTVIHLINCLLVYYAFGHNNISFLTALLFAVNPAGSQGSVWLSGKGYSISAGLTLLVYWLFPPIYFLTSYFSFNALLAPFLFIKGQWWWCFMILVYWKLAKGERGVALERLENSTGKGRNLTIEKFIISVKTIGYYFCLALFPVRLGIYHTFLYTYSLTEKDNKYWERLDKFFWIGCVFLISFIYAWFFHYSKAVFGLYWFLLFIIQWSNIITLNQSVAERYIYLPLMGMMYFLVNMIMMIPDYTWRMVAFFAVFVYYLTRLQLHIPMYYSIYNCIDYGMLNFPDQYVYYTWLGQLNKRKGRFFTALEAWMNGYKMRPIDFRLNNNIAVMLTDLGYLDDSEDFLKNAEENLLPEQRKGAQTYLDNERKRIAKAREILRNKRIAEKIKK